MNAWSRKSLQDFFAERRISVDPSKFLEEVFDLYSIPAFDDGNPEVCQGREIGSAKQTVQPGDVLLSRIVPHIRRTWVVPEGRGRRQIASGEWIVFRGQGIYPRFLRYFLVSDVFHAQFMQTVSGVGGSLLRAKPTEVGKIHVFVPPLSEQKRIVDLLDEVDELRKLRAQADRRTVELVPATFHDMFGDPVSNPRGWDIRNIEEVCSRVTDGTHDTPAYVNEGVPLVTSKNLRAGVLDLSEIQYISRTDHEDVIKRSHAEGGDILFAMIGTIGNAAIVPHGIEISIKNVGLFKPDHSKTTTEYLHAFLSYPSFLQGLLASSKGITQKFVGLGMLRSIGLPLPPLLLQKQFSNRVADAHAIKVTQLASRRRLDDLFQSMLQRAFNGEL